MSVLAIGLVIAGCAKAPPKESSKETPAVSNQVAVKKPAAQMPRVSKRPTNLNGSVFVLEYHHIRDGKGDMFRPTASFTKDLQSLYDLGFRPVTATEYLSNTMDLPPGASPVVMTFDDSNPSQIRFDDTGKLEPTCAVGIWTAFAAKHPDFPVKGTFFVLPDEMWGQKKWIAEKVKMLRSTGSELANHTTTHPQLKRLTDDQVKKEIAVASDSLVKWGEPMPPTLALPYGIAPKNKDLLKGFTYLGKKYDLKGVFLVGANPAPSPTDPKLNITKIPRIQAYPGELGSDYWLGELRKGHIKVYVK